MIELLKMPSSTGEISGKICVKANGDTFSNMRSMIKGGTGRKVGGLSILVGDKTGEGPFDRGENF